MHVIAGDKINGPKLPPFEERSDDIDSYLKRFKRHAEAHYWHKTIWATHPKTDFADTTLSLLPQSKVNQYIPSLTLFL
jgi:hypothetical protein